MMIHQFYLENAERYLSRAGDARRRGDIKVARFCLLKAAEMFYKLAVDSKEPLKTARKQRAAALLNEAEGLHASDSKPAQANTVTSNDDATEHVEGEAWRLDKETGVRFSDIAGLEEVKALLKRRVIYPWQHPEVAERYHKQAGGGVMLYGPPGTGKTMLARAIASEVGAAFFVVNCSDLLSKWVGEAEKNIRALFAATQKEDLSIIFMDEAEALLRRRGGDSEVMNRLVPEFLSQVDGLLGRQNGLLMLGATNRPWDLDEAALRHGRFGELVYVPLPESSARLVMLGHRLSKIPMDHAVDLESLVLRTEGYSGADIASLCEKIKDAPFEREILTGEKQQIEMADIEAALAVTHPSVRADHLKRYLDYAAAR